jgi:hypothetical protein
MSFYFRCSCKYTRILRLGPVIFSLTPCVWLLSLVPTLPIPLHLIRRSFVFSPNFFRAQLRVNQEFGVLPDYCTLYRVILVRLLHPRVEFSGMSHPVLHKCIGIFRRKLLSSSLTINQTTQKYIPVYLNLEVESLDCGHFELNKR